MKVTLNAGVPLAIVADTKVLANSPFAMIQAGYGDIIGKYSCLCDWQLSALVNGEYICPRILELTYAAVERTVALTDKIIARSEDAIGALMEALVTVGILMAYVGNSRPASGSEHHLSHYFEIVGLERNEEYLPHGIDVAFSSLETAKLRERLLSLESIDGYERHFSRERYEREINRIYGSVAAEVIALQDKVGWYGIDRTDVYREKWQEIRQVLSNAPTADETLALLDRAGLKYSDFLALYGKEKIDDALLYAKDLKDRYSVLWIYFDLLAGI
jgi:glycerol-1-phosphate dehydrogenase [NAD(P)+]